ncbi:hypothetical protein COLO4_25892 [Corchorus olitorius]|uniref:TIR domain-containing protein n=1 Tax=Corchorus olitorius TaxID=93759 RepID=A0A1R3HZJ9_9ROSI|nr:hypothetical protein COLO4_25892 [Corchorus olitorius]
MASSSTADVSKYQVFVTFRGEDTRYNFTSHLLNGLKDRGIHFFFDDRRVEIGDQLSSALLGAIDESKISVIVFSKNYANSSWCLEEVSHIMDCWHSRQQLVVPIFYHVDPSHVRNQTGSFEEAFVEHVRRGTETNKIQRWRDALKEAGNLSGWHLAGDKPEPIVIEAIVEDILSKLNLISKRDYEGQGLVGVRPKLEQIKSLLNRYYEEDVGMIGIWGMGGIGKTTLAQAIFNEVLGEFESGHFLANVREELEKRGAITLRKEMLSTLLNEENLRANSIYLQVTKDRLRSKRVVIVLDDVDDFRKLEELQIYKNNFGSGSRIIVTSRDKQVLQDAKVDAIYEVKELNDPEDLQIFCLHAFGQQNHLVDYDFRDLSAKLLKYVKGLPIALKVLGKGT